MTEPEIAQSELDFPIIGSDDKRPTIISNLGKWFRRTHRFVSLGTDDRASIWLYNKDIGIWRPNGIDFIRHISARILDAVGKYDKGMITQILANIKDIVYREDLIREKGFTYQERPYLGGPPDKIVMGNGVYDLETHKFSTEFKPDEYHITGIPITFDPDAKCPRIEKFFKEVIGHEKDIKAIEEFIGYCLWKDYSYAIIIFLVGTGANGKSTLIRLIEMFLGRGNWTSHSLQELNDLRHARADLFGKLMNIAGDIPSSPLKDFGMLKVLTGNDAISPDQKFKASITFVNHAKLAFSCNIAPPIMEDTDAVWRRLRTIPFPNTFMANDPKTKSQDKLLATLTTQAEMSGLFNLAMQGWKRLREKGKLTGTVDNASSKEAYTIFSDITHYMVQKGWLYRDPMALPVRCSVPYEYFAQVSDVLKRKKKDRRTFGKDLRKYLAETKSKQITIADEGRVWHYEWLGINYDGLNKWLDDKDVEPIARIERNIPVYNQKEESIVLNNKKTSSMRATSADRISDDLFQTKIVGEEDIEE